MTMMTEEGSTCPGLVKALENSKIVIAFPDYTAVVVWYGDKKVHILNPMGCVIDIQDIDTDSEPEVRQRMEAFIERIRKYVQGLDEDNSSTE